MAQKSSQPGYVFQPRDPSIYCEIYFPHKAAYQGKIYTALLDGKDPEKVRKYLKDSIKTGLTTELAVYHHLLDPDLYGGQEQKIEGGEEARARVRID